MQLCLVAEAEVQHTFSSVSDGFHQKMESKKLSHLWWNAASVWWAKNYSSFYKGFYTGLCVVWFLGGGGLILAVLSGVYTFASHYSWHTKVKGQPMLPLHRVGCA